MKVDQKDVVFCRQGAHAVPRAEINKLYADNGKTFRACCNNCKAEVMAQREQVKQAFRNRRTNG